MKKNKHMPFDWDKIKNLCMADCNGVEIASYIGVHPETLYKRCKKDNGISFTEFHLESKSKGDSLLKAKQYEIAMKGDKKMLVWLGKNRLGQSEKLEQKTNLTSENKVTIYIPDNGRN